MFVGFSSDEEEERGDTLSPIELIPAQVPPGVLSSATIQGDSGEFPAQASSPSDVSLSAPAPQLPPKTSPSDTPTSQGVVRRGPLSSVLPEGCEVFLTESGEEVYTCSCETSFTQKKNLLRHCQDCPNINISSFEPDSQSKRRRLGSLTENEIVDMDSSGAESPVTTNQEAIKPACFKEDPAGTNLLKCELL